MTFFKRGSEFSYFSKLGHGFVQQIQNYPNITGNGLFLNILKFQLKVTLSKFKVLTDFIKSPYSSI